MKSISVTLIIPCYNEENNILKGVIDSVGNYTRHHSHIKEVLIIDDGSTDRSVKLIRNKYLDMFPKLRLVENRHQGKAIAVITGMEQATSDYIIFTDADLATPLDEIEKIIDKFEAGENVVIGSRAGRRKGAPLTRKIQAKGFMILRNLLMGLKGITDTQCGCKGFKREVALEIIRKLQIFTHDREVEGASVSAAFDLEFLFVARKLGYAIIEVPVKWHHAETKNVSLWKDSIETISDLVRMRMYELQGKYS